MGIAYAESASYVVPNTSIGCSLASIISLLLPVVALALIGVLVLVQIKIANNMARIAADKGYTERKWWHYVFWLGIIGILMICAMPDKNRQ